MENEIRDERQLGGVEGMLGTVDQLLIDVCIVEKVEKLPQKHRRRLL